jgi:hypothetical protein
MKIVTQSKLYNTDKMESLGSRDRHSHSGTLAGITRLMHASDGTFWLWTDANGLDTSIWSRLEPCADVVKELERMELSDDDEARCAALKLITIISRSESQ